MKNLSKPSNDISKQPNNLFRQTKNITEQSKSLFKQSDSSKRPSLAERRARRSLRLTVFESSITEGLIAMSIMTLFYAQEIGMNQAEIALSQSIFTVVVMVLNFPLGWIADRFSRKWANIIGDLGVFVGFLLYSGAQDFLQVVLCECLLGISLAFSQGVDQSLLQHFASQLDPSGQLFRRQSINLASLRYICILILVLLGGPIGAISFRLAIAVSGVPSLIGAVASMFIHDDSPKLQSRHRNPLGDMYRIGRETWRNRPLRLRSFAYVVSREMTHGIIWVFTPMLIAVGVPVTVVSFAWVANSCACLFGSRLAAKISLKMRDSQNFALPFACVVISMVAISYRLSLGTIWLYGLMGVAQGLTGSTMLPMVQRYAKEDEQTSVISLVKVGGQLLYIPVVWLIGRAADLELRFAAVATLLIFVPLGVYVLGKLIREEGISLFRSSKVHD